MDTYDAGLLSSYGGGDVAWWHDYIRAELARAHDFYQAQLEQTSHARQVFPKKNFNHQSLNLDNGGVYDTRRK